MYIHLMNHNKLQIKEFKLDSMVANPSILIIAKSGKSFIARDIIYHYRHVPAGAVIAPTDRMNPFYKHFFPDLYIHHDINDSTLNNILLRQSIMIDKKRTDKTIDPSSILVMDDCLTQKKSWAKNHSIMEILMNGRHYGLTYILSVQIPLGITPDLRMNFDYIFLLREDSIFNKKKLWDNYASVFPTYELFDGVFKKCTENYAAMVIDNRKPCDKIQDKIFWYKAREHKFVFGSREFKNIHKKFYDSHYNKKHMPDNDLVRESGRLRGKSEIFIDAKNNTPQINSDYMFDYFINSDKLKIEFNNDNINVKIDSKPLNNLTSQELPTSLEQNIGVDYLFKYFGTNFKPSELFNNYSMYNNLIANAEIIQKNITPCGTPTSEIKSDIITESYEPIINKNNDKIDEKVSSNIHSKNNDMLSEKIDPNINSQNNKTNENSKIKLSETKPSEIRLRGISCELDRQESKIVNELSGGTLNNQNKIDTDYLYNYFMNDKINNNTTKKNQLAFVSSEIKNKKINHEKISDILTDDAESNYIESYNDSDNLLFTMTDPRTDITAKLITHEKITPKINTKQKTNKNDIIQLVYKDDTYQFAAHITNLDNHKLIKILCDHIENLKTLPNVKSPDANKQFQHISSEKFNPILSEKINHTLSEKINHNLSEKFNPVISEKINHNTSENSITLHSGIIHL
jgi:hypothetical protein